ncbi:MAG: peptidoglycan DD-metalloendopeptidase family protein [Gemmatimonadales bacterium]
MKLIARALSGLLLLPSLLSAQDPPPIPGSPRVLALAAAPDGAVWAGTYGAGIYVLRQGGTAWEHIVADTVPGSISWDFVHAFAFGGRGQVWYGTVGNGWGLSTDGGKTWRNWTFRELGPEWQYVAPSGIAARGDSAWVATADGVQFTPDAGATWVAFGDSTGPAAKGPAAEALPLLRNEYVRAMELAGPGIVVTHLRGSAVVWHDGKRWRSLPHGTAARARQLETMVNSVRWQVRRGQLTGATVSLASPMRASGGGKVEAPKTTWFARPIAPGDNSAIDQTYRYGSTMGGNFQQHQGVEFNNPDGTPVLAVDAGEVVYAGRAEAGALTVAIRHDSIVTAGGKRHRIHSVYYHNSALDVSVGDRVTRGQQIARVGNTGRATNDHLHLEIHPLPEDEAAGVAAVVDSLQRFPRYTTNPELWIEPLPGTGIVAGRVLDGAKAPVPQARVYGIWKPDPRETPFAFAETYGDKAHPHPLYGENFAVSDVPVGEYVLYAEKDGKRVGRPVGVVVEPGRVSWVDLR